jgi:hypothetical protein
VVHAELRNTQVYRSARGADLTPGSQLRVSMDCRVKPGNDEKGSGILRRIAPDSVNEI